VSGANIVTSQTLRSSKIIQLVFIMNNDIVDYQIGVSLQMRNSQKTELLELARKNEMSLSRIIRVALREGIDAIRRNPPPALTVEEGAD
jgi:hypothetical protein